MRCYQLLPTLFLLAMYCDVYAASPDAFRAIPDRAGEINEQRLRQLEEQQRRSLLTPPP